MSEHERSLRCLALNDEAVIESLLGMQLQPTKTSGLDVFLIEAVTRVPQLIWVWATGVAEAAGELLPTPEVLPAWNPAKGAVVGLLQVTC